MDGFLVSSLCLDHVRDQQVHQRDWDKKATQVGRFEKTKCIFQMRRKNVHYCKIVL